MAQGGFTSFNADELEALYYLPCRAVRLYLMYLRVNVDRANCIVGLKKRICYQGMREALEERRVAGSTIPNEKPSIDAVRAALKQLASAGLIERVSGYEHTLVFRLPLATRKEKKANASLPHNFVSVSNTRSTPEQHQIRSAPGKIDSDAGSEDMNNRGTTEKNRKNRQSSPPPPLSNIHSHSVAAAIPNSTRAREELAQVLLELFPDQKKTIDNNQTVQQMIDAWVDVGVCTHHVRRAYREISQRPGLDSFGPAYLRSLVLEFAAVDGLQVRRERHAEREAQADRAMCQSLEQWAKERGLEWDPRGGVPYSTWVERTRIKKLKEERGAADG
ncbi:MAG: hypothetical protein ABW082_04645 [Sedimenticola sp.]